MTLFTPARPGPTTSPLPGRPPGGIRRPAHRAAAGLLLAVCALTVLPAPALADEDDGRVLRVAPGGDGDGSSWSAAAGLDDLPELVEQLSDGGGQVWLRADQGAYEVERSIALTDGGSDDEPVVIRGVDSDGDPQPAQLRSDRADPYDEDGRRGKDVFKLREGANNLTFQDLQFRDVGAAWMVTGPVAGLRIEQVDADNIRYLLTTVATGGSDSAPLRGLRMRDVDVDGFSKSVLLARYDSSDLLLEDVVGDSQGQDGDDFAMGVALQGRTHDVVLRRVRMDNAVARRGDGYWNGDGFATERGVKDVLLQDTSASGNADAGYDLKSTGTRLVDAAASGNKRNFRFWSDDGITCLRCVGEDPNSQGGSGSAAQVWLAEDAQAELEDSRLLDSGDLVVEASDDAQLDITGGRITRDDDGELARTDPGADVDLDDVDTPDSDEDEGDGADDEEQS